MGKWLYGGVSMRFGLIFVGVRDWFVQEMFDISLLVGFVYENSVVRKKMVIKKEFFDIIKCFYQVLGKECFKFKY